MNNLDLEIVYVLVKRNGNAFWKKVAMQFRVHFRLGESIIILWAAIQSQLDCNCAAKSQDLKKAFFLAFWKCPGISSFLQLPGKKGDRKFFFWVPKKADLYHAIYFPIFPRGDLSSLAKSQNALRICDSILVGKFTIRQAFWHCWFARSKCTWLYQMWAGKWTSEIFVAFPDNNSRMNSCR